MATHLDLDPAAEAMVAQIRQQASMWASLNPFGEKDEKPKAESVMSAEELTAKFSGKELDDPALIREPNQAIETQAELYEQHMRTVAGDMGVDMAGIDNIDELTDAVQRAQDNGGVAPQSAGENYMTAFVGGDIAPVQEVSLADIETAGPAPTPDGRGGGEERQIG